LSYSDGNQTPTPSFSGDETGKIFDNPDIVRQSPLTDERSVDTQSGFLVVVKTHNGKIALFVKRKVGTPPSSAIYLTPDESLRLSGILADQVVSKSGGRLSSRKIKSSVEGLIDHIVRAGAGRAELDTQNGQVTVYGSQIAQSEQRLIEKGNSLIEPNRSNDYKARVRSGRPGRPKMQSNKAIKLTMLAGLLFLSLSAIFFGSQFFSRPVSNLSNQEQTPELKRQIERSSVDQFVRNFVSNMLDFNPASYKFSQIQAMAQMTGPVLEKYWSETRFPLSTRQLRSLPQGQTVMITKISQERSAPDETNVDIFADLLSTKSKVSNPIHLNLRLKISPDKQIKVASMQDLTLKK
jgi:hypothetical protein